MGQVTPWRYSSTGNESTERATGRYPWSRFLFDPPPPRPPNASNLLFDIHSRYSLHETGFFHESTCRHNPLRLPPDLVVDGASCHLGRFYDSTIGVRVRARKSRGGGHGIEPSAGYRGMFLALLGVVAYRECIVCWSGR